MKENKSTKEESINQELLPTEEDRRTERKSEATSIMHPEIKTVTITDTSEREQFIEGEKNMMIKKTGSLCKEEDKKRTKLGKR